ncbi:hypothetical protein PG995_003812 [Apiospora arundinis]|uniref:DUF7624 domain-containing protein n=1 Tax=Apiospora arundinis TaxID=335852 RepID=A0ABR2HRB4_9PEZI
MALEAPLKSTTGNILAAFSPLNEYPISSPESPALHSHFRTMSSVGSVESNSLRPSSIARASSANNHLMSPSDIVGPSPVTSVGTEVTEIEDEASDDAKLESASEHSEPQPQQLLMLRTNISDQVRQSLSEEAVSVIHAPESFQSWASSDTALPQTDATQEKASPKGSPKPENIRVPPLNDNSSKARSPGLPTPPPISTNVGSARFSLESATPRAQNLQEVQSSLSDSSRIRSSSTSSLELIPESREPETDAEPETEADYEDEFVTPSGDEDMDIRSLKTALAECWTLCNTLATLSTHHRERVFITSGTPDDHERAWKCCWKLCQRLYDNRDEDDTSFNVRVNLDLCRDFCQALFDVRQRKDETADSVLRVSFELNNHLYSAQDNRNLPEAFRERTLDFYITLCHRLMKQRNELAEETDSLLRACWSLAEMLFSIRQNKRDGKVPDEELLGSAVQACWELCDIFREGWTQIRPDRGTPRPSQANFFNYQPTSDREQDGRASRTSNRSKRDSLKSAPQDKPRKPPPVPETPVTEFEDTPISPDQSPQVPNIMVFGTENNRNGGRWSSSASNLSSYSQSSQRTSSTATTATTAEDVNISRLKMLILKAAMNVGFSRDDVTKGHNGAASLQAFVKSLPTGSFGSLPTHTTLLQNYKNLVVADSSFRQASTLPSKGKRVTANDMAKSITWMTHRSAQYSFLRDLFKLVFGFQMDEAETRKNVSISV